MIIQLKEGEIIYVKPQNGQGAYAVLTCLNGDIISKLSNREDEP